MTQDGSEIRDRKEVIRDSQAVIRFTDYGSPFGSVASAYALRASAFALRASAFALRATADEPVDGSLRRTSLRSGLRLTHLILLQILSISCNTLF